MALTVSTGGSQWIIDNRLILGGSLQLIVSQGFAVVLLGNIAFTGGIQWFIEDPLGIRYRLADEGLGHHRSSIRMRLRVNIMKTIKIINILNMVIIHNINIP